MSDLICVIKSEKSHTAALTNTHWHSIAGQVADIFVSWKVAAAAVAVAAIAVAVAPALHFDI